jgi:signal transduction histidine kinase
MGANPNLILFNLPGGKYTAQFTNKISGHTVTQRFSIASPFWQHWWFPPIVLLIITAVIAIIFYFIYKIQLRQKLRTQLIRDNIARDLHDDIGSYLSSISILSQNVDMMLASNPEKAKTSLSKIGETARQVMDTMGDIVWSINPNQDTMPLIIQRMRDLVFELFSEQNVQINFTVDDSIKEQNISLEKKRDFYLIFKEAVTNIQKYAKASIVDVNIRDEESNIVLIIEDDGVGFANHLSDNRRSNGGNGIVNMNVRAKRLGGSIDINSKKGIGTSVLLSFPK